MTDRLDDSLSRALRDRLEADRRATATPPVGLVLARARHRTTSRVAAAALAIAVVVGGAALALPADAPAPDGLDVAGGDQGPVLLAEGTDGRGAWQLLGRASDRCLLLVRAGAEGGSCGLADPPRLEETSVQSVGRGASAETLVAGLVPDGADVVAVDPTVGEARAAVSYEDAGLRWFVARLPGVTGLDGVVALRDGQEVARTSTPLPPPPEPRTPASAAPGLRAPVALRLTATDEFGRVTALREGPEGLEVDVDRVDWLSGQEAVDAAAARGEEPGGDYYLVDDSTRTRTYGLTNEAVVWGSIGFGAEPSAPERVTLDRWQAFLQTEAGGQALFHLDLKDGVVLGIEEQYQP